jgi:hypothetical protein
MKNAKGLLIMSTNSIVILMLLCMVAAGEEGEHLAVAEVDVVAAEE